MRRSWLTHSFALQLLDNVVFQLAKNGFFGHRNKHAAIVVSTTEYKLPAHEEVRLPFLMTGLLLVSFLGMISGLIVVFKLQLDGVFLPQHIVLQFNDNIKPELSTFSGMYKLQVNKKVYDASRVVYTSIMNNNDATVGYCPDVEAWTIGYGRKNDYCANILALSSHPTNQDISLILGAEWFVQIEDDSKLILPMEDVYSSTGCESDLDCGGSTRGVCKENRCICSERHFGLRCHHREDAVCETIRTNEQLGDFEGLRRRVSFNYKVLRDEKSGELALAYEHPVYVGTDHDTGEGTVDIILYT